MKQKAFGLGLIGIAILGWAIFIILPFFDMPNGTKAAIMTTVLVIAEVSFLVASLILGKEYVSKVRRFGLKKKAPDERN